jgi:hypothetical protein
MRYEIIAPRGGSEETLQKQRVLPPFSEVVLDFIDAVSGSILKDKMFRQYPELMAMAFWMRKPNILKLKEVFEKQKGDRLWLGRGIVFHIAPSNVDTIFIYSWFISMLVGNVNIVRVSSASGEQLEVLVGVINKIAEREEFSAVRERFMIVKYEHNDEITSRFSSVCNVRVLWGGDETIRRIRAIPIGPTATELVFADKFSFSVINADVFLSYDKKDALITSFYNDAYWFGQNACSSPRLVVWIGDDSKIDQARTTFWEMLEKKAVEKQVAYPAAIAVDKLVAECSMAMASTGSVVIESKKTNLLNRVLLEKPEDINRGLHCGGGLFYELKIKNVSELAGIISPKDQTVTVFGLGRNELKRFIDDCMPDGISRIVPISQALDFSVIWDGYDLLREFCREIEITI